MITYVTAPARLGETILPDGRTLGWAEWGPEDGRPVLLCPGAATSRWLGFGADVVEHLGIRLISVDRPGLGASTPAPGRTLSDWAVDVANLAAARGLSDLGVVGFSQGAPFAIACAAAGVVRRVAIVAGGDELANPCFAGRLTPDVQRLVDAVAADPAAAEQFFAGWAGAQTMWEMVVGMSGPDDRAIYTSPAFAAAYRQALDEAFAQRPAGYARDTVLAMAPWPFDPGSITVPVDLWYGAQDTSPVHSPDLGETLLRRIPGAQRHLVDGAGGAVLWTHAEPILRTLLGEPIYLETERLVLRRFTEGDVENLVELDGDPEVMRYINGGKPRPRAVIETDFLPRFRSYYDRYAGFGFWAAIEKATGEFVGWFHFRPEAGHAPDDVELGYRLRRSAWGKGYATEGSIALIRKGFTELGVRRVYATTMAVNLGSRRVMEKAGLKFVRTFHMEWPEPIAGTEQGEVEYALEKAEWVDAL